MKRVAVSQRIDEVRGETRDSLDQKLVSFIAEAEGCAIPVPNNIVPLSRLDYWIETIRPEMIILSGGNDIGQYPSRDITEGRLLDYALANHLPVLGICRGMQMLGHRAGARLKPVSGHVATRHQLLGAIEGEFNSYHNFSLADCPDDYDVLARSADGEIEAIRHRELCWEGWMWHPERESLLRINDVRRLKDLMHA